MQNCYRKIILFTTFIIMFLMFSPSLLLADIFGTPYVEPTSINPKRDVSVTVKCRKPRGQLESSGYPRLYMGNDYVQLRYVSGPNDEAYYSANLGKFSAGSYKGTILAYPYGESESETVYFTCRENKPSITQYEGKYITPESNINPSKEVSIQINCNTGDTDVYLENEYPRVYIYKNGNLGNPMTINGNLCTVLTHIQGSENGYRANLGKFDIGDYTYKIVAKNEFKKEHSVTGTFVSNGINSPSITKYDGKYIVPEEDINPSKDVSIQVTCTAGEEGISLANEYPRVYIYDNYNNPIEINNSKYTILTKIEDSENGYRANLGKFDIGDYTYKIVAKNECDLESYINGAFSSVVNNLIITEHNIHPTENIDIHSNIIIKMTYSADKDIKLANEYPRVYIYRNSDLENPIEINNSTCTVLSKIENSENSYNATVGNLPVGDYTYKIIAKNEFGLESSVSGNFSVTGLDMGICFNAPNPFNPNRTATTIRFNCNKAETITINIYSLNGKLIFKDKFNAVIGTNDYIYKGKDSNGNNLYNGVYLCVIERKEGNLKCKIAIVK